MINRTFVRYQGELKRFEMSSAGIAWIIGRFYQATGIVEKSWNSDEHALYVVHGGVNKARRNRVVLLFYLLLAILQ